MNTPNVVVLASACLLIAAGGAAAGPYSAAQDDPDNPFDAPVPGFVGPDGDGLAPDWFPGSGNRLNPLFFGWGHAAVAYHRADGEVGFSDPSLALGAPTGDDFDVVSLGDLSAAQITAGAAPGSITLSLARPLADLPGADFAVFENGMITEVNQGGAGIGGIFAELAFVEVSSDGVHFARFPSISLTAASVGGYGSIHASNVFNLAGKHVNSGGRSWGTPFDLSQLAADPLVLGGTVDLQAVTHIRLVDIPGNGAFLDSLANPIYDPHLTFGSGGFDLEAIGAISVPVTFSEWVAWHDLPSGNNGASHAPDADGIPNLVKAALGIEPGRASRHPATTVVAGAAVPGIAFTRDLRLRGARLVVEASTNLNDWLPAAQAIDGAPIAAVPPFSASVADDSASPIRSIGVIRNQRVEAVSGHPAGAVRFLRLRVEEEAGP